MLADFLFTVPRVIFCSMSRDGIPVNYLLYLRLLLLFVFSISNVGIPVNRREAYN
jgi:hypothetical protein